MTVQYKSENNQSFKTNIIKNRYVTDGNIWTIDETMFNKNTKLFLIVNIKTRAIVGYSIYKNYLTEEILMELYEEIFLNNSTNNPIVIHSDNQPIFNSQPLLDFLSSKKVKVSFTLTNKNQVSESINERIKTLVTKKLITQDNQALRNWRKTIPNKYKYLKIVEKSRNVEFRKLLFNSEFLEQNKIKRKNRKRLRFPKREPITTDIYNFLISQTETIDYQNRYRAARLRLALVLLAITGHRY